MECPSSPPRVLFECDFCEGVFHTVRALRAHRYKVHGIESNAEVMVDVEHVACQMDTVNSYAEPDVTPEVTIDWQLPGTTENAKHRPKRKQCRRIQRPPSIKKQKNKIQKAKNRQKAIMKKRRMTLDNMPSCFQVMPPGSEAVAEVSKSVEFDILKSIYGDQGAKDPDLLQGSVVVNGVSLAEPCPAENPGKSKEEKDAISLIKSRESDFCPPQIDPCDLTCPSRPSNQQSLECIPQHAQCVNLSNVLTVLPTTEPEHSCTQGNGTISVGSSVPLVVPDDISRQDESSEESCVLDLSMSAKKDKKSDSPDSSPEQKPVKRSGSGLESVNNKISVISSHPGNGQTTGQCVTQAHSKHFTYSGSHPSAPVLRPDNKPRRTRTKARLKRNLHRGPDKKLPRLNCSLTPFSLKPTPVSDSPPHLSPVTSLPPPAAQPSDTPPRVPKVRLKRKNSTEFKAYVIPCAGTNTGNEDSSENDKSDDDDERSMPNLERQADLPIKSLSSSAEDSMFDFRKTPPSLLKDGDICSTSDMADGIEGSAPRDALTLFEKAAPVISKNNVHLLASDYHEDDQDFKRPAFDSLASTSSSAVKTEMTEVGLLTDGQVKTEPEVQDSNDGLQKEESNKTFVCQFCGKVYKWLIHFKVHESKHAGGKAFKCHSCDFSAVDRKDVLRHCDAENHTILKSSVHAGPTECTWLGDIDLKYSPMKVSGIFMETSSPWQQKKQHRNKEVNKIPKQDRPVDMKCLTGLKEENKVSGKKRNTSRRHKASTQLDLKGTPELIKKEPHSPPDNWQTGDLLSEENRLHQSKAGFSRTLLPGAKVPDASQDLLGKVYDEISGCNQVKADEQDVLQVKDEPLLLNHILSCQSCVQNGSSDAQHVDCFNEVVRGEVLEQEGEMDLLSLGRKKKKKYNKLFNHRTRKRVRKMDNSLGPSKVIKRTVSESGTGMQQADLRNKESAHDDDQTVVDHSLNHGDEEARANTETFPQVEAKCETGTKVASEKETSLGSSSNKPKKSGSNRKEPQRQKNKALQPKKLLAKKQKGQLKKSILHKGKESSHADKKLSQKKKVFGANSVPGKKTNKNGGKKGTVISTKKSSIGQKRRYCKKNIVSQCFVKSIGKGQDGQGVTENKRSSQKGSYCSESKQSDVLGRHVVVAECNQKAKESKDRHLSVFGRHQNNEVAVVGGHRCQKSSDNSTHSESLERRRPGLVHRRYLALDDDADDDVGYHSSGSLDQVPHDEAHDSGGWKDSQSRQSTEGRPVLKEPKDNQQVMCQHICQLMNNLFEDSLGSPSHQTSSSKLPRHDLSAVKAEPLDDEETKMSTCSSSSQSLFDLLLTAKENSERGPQSDSEVFSTSIKVKEEPSDKDEASRLKAKNALTNFAAKLSQFKFKVKPEPLKCQKDGGVSATTSQIKVEQPEPTKASSQDDKATSDLKSNSVTKRCDSGIYVDASSDVTGRSVSADDSKDKVFKSDVEADLLPTKLERSLWDCILPDILSKPLTSDGKPELLTKLSTEGTGPDKDHYLYCPACCSQVLIRADSYGSCSKQTEPPPLSAAFLGAAPSSTDKAATNISADGVSTCGDDWSAPGGRIRSCTLPAGGPGHTLEGAVHLLSSLGMSWPERAPGLSCLIDGLQKTCKLDAAKRRLFSDSCSLSHGACCGNERFRAAFHCCRCITDRPAPNQRIRLIKHHTQIVCCHTVMPIHRTLQGSYPWQHISGRHSHTDDCIYSGC